jgi:hypothetical protein
MVDNYPHLSLLPLKNTKMRCGNEGLNDNCSDPRHIEFNGRSVTSREIHRKMMENELRMRNIQPESTRSPELRLQLHEILLVENSFNMLSKILAANSLEEAMVRLEKALPCLLHLENRTSEALIGRLVHRGWQLCEGCNRAIDIFVGAMETLMNECFFGSPECPSAWKFPLEDDGTMGDFKFANWRARRIVENYDQLVELCLPGQENEGNRDAWCRMSSLYRGCIKALSQKKDFSDTQIDSFQTKADNFFSAWLDLIGYDGVSNYIYMLGAGHIRYFLKKWRNLHRFSNQGWEAYNALVAGYWHHRTQKGGGRGENSKINAIQGEHFRPFS